MKRETLYDEYMKDEEFARVMAQEDLIMDVTEKFLEILEGDGISKSNLSKRMEKTRGYVTQLFNGRRNMSLRVLSDIAHYLGYNVRIVFRKKGLASEPVLRKLEWKGGRKKMFVKDDFATADSYADFGSKVERLGM